MNKLYSYDEFKQECLKNKYSKANYESNDTEVSEEHMKRSYEAYVFRFNAIKKAVNYEEAIKKKYENLNKNNDNK